MRLRRNESKTNENLWTRHFHTTEGTTRSSVPIQVLENRPFTGIFNNYSLKSREIFCRYSPKLKRIIVLVYTHEVISTTDNFDIFKRKPIKDNFIDVSIHAGKTHKWYRQCPKRLFIECLNMTDRTSKSYTKYS